MLNERREQEDVEVYFENDNFMAPLTHDILSQYVINKGLKMFGERGEEAITKELK